MKQKERCVSYWFILSVQENENECERKTVIGKEHELDEKEKFLA